MQGSRWFEAGGDFADGVIAFEGRRLGGSILPPASIAEQSKLIAANPAAERPRLLSAE